MDDFRWPHEVCVCSSMSYSLWPLGLYSTNFSVHGIFQARILGRVAISSSRGSSPPRDRTCVSCISCVSMWILYHWAHWEAWHLGEKRDKCTFGCDLESREKVMAGERTSGCFIRDALWHYLGTEKLFKSFQRNHAPFWGVWGAGGKSVFNTAVENLYFFM